MLVVTDEGVRLLADSEALVERARADSESLLARLEELAGAQDEAGLRALAEQASRLGAEVREIDARLHAIIGGAAADVTGGGA